MLDLASVLEIGLISVGFGFVGVWAMLKLALPSLINRLRFEIDQYIAEIPARMTEEPEFLQGFINPLLNYVSDPKIASGLAKSLIPAFLGELQGGNAGPAMKDIKIGGVKIPGMVLSGLIERFLPMAGEKAAEKAVAAAFG